MTFEYHWSKRFGTIKIEFIYCFNSSIRLVPMQAIVRAIAPSRRRERGWRRARATRRALLLPPGDRQARAGRRVGDGVFAGESERRQ